MACALFFLNKTGFCWKMTTFAFETKNRNCLLMKTINFWKRVHCRV